MTNGVDIGRASESEAAAAAKRAGRRELIRRLATAVVAVVAGKSRLAAAS
jgi:hypothetical protein